LRKGGKTMVTEQDDIVKELNKYDLSEIIEAMNNNEETYLPVIVLENGNVQIDPRFTSHA
jgi:hypothetical protein